MPGDEYIPVMAIQAVDKESAVAAMDTVRTLLADTGRICAHTEGTPSHSDRCWPQRRGRPTRPRVG
ncbi:hypothetical protein I545_1576 [Mycobacterium kansasii 662]|uniref:Uncharacterized protein n=2 Tax=Mycobacterium kansasii TaxID=1768 RepID=A0A1V3WEZ2_MYCKA|nr:hypothetical protein I547_4978 [Mycobacterium kansasii 824]EUA21484.1 hypothetical protein I545_1576 [Mycobacterium kansasii 662]KEP42405.1 hypothetical protein MKSMC1_24470 [Mycobacterium kansasii]OOK64996.1 hypothetical protein BZL30_8992 [Mycobacterium kansasii]OOK76876.1 hypothetical protein BZL29_2955 [Mycobacterium kansasii]